MVVVDVDVVVVVVVVAAAICSSCCGVYNHCPLLNKVGMRLAEETALHESRHIGDLCETNIRIILDSIRYFETQWPFFFLFINFSLFLLFKFKLENHSVTFVCPLPKTSK